MPRVTCRRFAFVALNALALGILPGDASADLTPSSSVLLDVTYTREADGETTLDNTVLAGMRTRHMFGGSIAWCTGLDAGIGATDSGFAYSADAYLAGLAIALGDEQFVSVCGGAGLNAAGDLPFAVNFPVELAAELQLGPVRPFAWVRSRWITGEDLRKEGSDTFSFADEMDATLGFRFGRNHRFWDKVTAGHGLFVGVHYAELGTAHFAGVTLGLHIWGGRR